MAFLHRYPLRILEREGGSSFWVQKRALLFLPAPAFHITA